MMNEFRKCLESTLRESIKKSKFQSNVEYMSSVSIVLVNLNREKSNEKMLQSLELSATEITDPVYEILTVRSILSLRGEHPLDVVRVKIWKMLRMSIEMKLQNLNFCKEELISFIENLSHKL